MKFKEWVSWYKSLCISYRWFIILIFLRPIVDNLYYLKEISPLVSPLYIVGVLTPFLAIWGIKQTKYYYPSHLDGILKIWLALILFSSMFIFINNTFDLKFYEIFFQTITAFAVYFFARRLIKSHRDIDGILMTFLYSSIIVACIILYEIIFHPFKNTISRGMIRLEGAYADVMNYSIYITQSILISGYFVLRKSVSLSKNTRITILITVLCLAFISLIRINHAASIGVSVALVCLFSLFYFQRSILQAIVFVSALLILSINFGSEVFQKNVLPLVQGDINIYEGEGEQEQMFHGRMSRWTRMWNVFSDQPITSQFFGMPLSMDKPYIYLSTGTHNEYLRIIFFSGFVGFIVYILFLFNVFLRLKNLTVPQKFLTTGALATMILFSISTGPNLYPPLIYVIYSIYAMAALPKNVLQNGT